MLCILWNNAKVVAYICSSAILNVWLYSYHSMFLQPPIQVYGVEGRYATALFSAASKQKSLDKVEQELGRVNVSYTLGLRLFVSAYFP